MSIKVAIRHTTTYSYDRPVQLFPQTIRLRPAPHCRSPVESYSLNINPRKHFINWQQDPFGNYVARVVFPEPTREFVVDVEAIIDLQVINPFDFFLEESAEHCPFTYDAQLKRDLGPCLQVRESGPKLQAYVASIDRSRQQTTDFLVALNQRIQREIAYIVRLEPGVLSCEDTLGTGKGSCRDSAWLLVQILRHLGLAARFVSGYLVQIAGDVRTADGPPGPERDFTDLHAWAEVYLPGAGWVGLDPTSGLLAGEGHLPLAASPDPAGAAPVSGATSPCTSTLSFVNSVQRIHERPRVTRPYSEVQWQRILKLGDAVDRKLHEGDVRLTMGGEPTFVSMDDMEGAEWNTAALGTRKRELADALLRRLKQRFASGGVYHAGQGKWYPGEPLPRWALSVFWRSDGAPLWQDEQWLAVTGGATGFGAAEAGRYMEALARRLNVAQSFVLPAYEDTYYLLWREGQLPANVDPRDPKLEGANERQRMLRRMSGAPQQPAGFVLPLEGRTGRDGCSFWVSSRWPLARGYLYLVPGDSAMGMRLPLDAVSQPAAGNAEINPLMDTFAERGALPARGRGASAAPSPRPVEYGPALRTALCVEARDGLLHVFLPPLSRLEQYVHLIDGIEETARELHMPVVLEGYEPPRDPRLRVLQVTPDPGVIEVNVHPAGNWRELVGITEVLYEEGRSLRLGTEKFMLDGRHSGTGGGNHVTLGGSNAADSPLLRRPDLLGSLITCWQNHPSLSYLFSGRFIGPTSQAPRVDEARDENLYELEIALKLLSAGDGGGPWFVDRVLRNFLVDLTGNTHRAEFCIDKLYSPDGPAGRRGLLEFRGFEMPPHARMSALQMLLLRALVARFWHRPLVPRLIQWGTELHDRYMLPQPIWLDFTEVIEELQGEGYSFQADWFLPFFEFRFPRCGSVHLRGMELELRTALEPWHVLGEESSAHGTARYVDSSVERIQVKLSDMPERRYSVRCNGRTVPLRATGTRGEYVAGVRYKAWAPSSARHPTLPVHAPLVFDLVDDFNERSIGGCTYHVAHPGGRNYESCPVNAEEAEGRRLARFWPHGHTPGALQMKAAEPHPACPWTLDLRYPAPFAAP